ncbi:hypothetical protein [Peribacillus kribbensis]|uniref:hypothetical protein n=1 Tax=Peribacillus kribbensis TaxID=356658 RepID=UPI0004163AF4|nr:hypothetical protein [Peribacillus kribbensis]
MHLPAAQAQQTAVQLMAKKANMQATVSGINDAFYWAAAICIAGIVLSFFLRDVRKDKKAANDLLALPDPESPKIEA